MVDVRISPALRALVRERQKGGGSPTPKYVHDSKQRAAEQERSRSLAEHRRSDTLSAGRPLVALRLRQSGRRPLVTNGMMLLTTQSSGRAGFGHFALNIYETADDRFVLTLEHKTDAQVSHTILTQEAALIDEVLAALHAVRIEEHLCVPRLVSTEGKPLGLGDLEQKLEALKHEFNAMLTQSVPEWPQFQNSTKETP